jgi:anti-anti-sigma factor
MSLVITVSEKKPGLFELALDGRLDTDTYGQLEAKLNELLPTKPKAVRFNMARLNYISSMGIRVFLKAFKALRGQKAMFLMADLQPQIKKVFDIAEALPPESVFASVEEADAYFDAMQRKVLEQDSGDA